MPKLGLCLALEERARVCTVAAAVGWEDLHETWTY